MVGRVPMPIASTIASLKEDNTGCRPRLCSRTLHLWCPCGTCRLLWSVIVDLALRSGLTGTARGYGYAQRGAVSIHLSEWDEHDPKQTGAVVYLYVSDADAVRAEWLSCGVEGRLSEPRIMVSYPGGDHKPFRNNNHRV